MTVREEESAVAKAAGKAAFDRILLKLSGEALMGPKITVDSATLANKGLELIEAHFLFGLPYERLEVVVHPTSVVHAIVRFRDGASLAHLGYPDMGSYGIGPARTMAAIVEQHHDEQGIQWPASVAPYDVHLVALPGLEERAAEVAAKLDAAGDAVLLDDRDQRAGEKFADADLIGLPVRVTVGKKTLEDGAVDIRSRATGEEQRVAIEDLGSLRADGS